MAPPRSGGRPLDPDPRGCLVQHGGEPLGCFCPFLLRPPALGPEPADLRTQLLALAPQPRPFLLGGLSRPFELVALVQELLDTLEDSLTFFHPPIGKERQDDEEFRLRTPSQLHTASFRCRLRIAAPSAVRPAPRRSKVESSGVGALNGPQAAAERWGSGGAEYPLEEIWPSLKQDC